MKTRRARCLRQDFNRDAGWACVEREAQTGIEMDAAFRITGSVWSDTARSMRRANAIDAHGLRTIERIA
jgi:hypothetical protein